MRAFFGWIPKYSAVFLPLIAVAFIACLLDQGAAAPLPRVPKVRLDNPVEISVPGVEIDAAVILPDNETLIVVGGQPWQPDNKDWVIADAPPAGAIVNLKTKAVRPFTNGNINRLRSVVCSADGARIYTACEYTSREDKDPFVRVWDVKAGKSLEPIAMPKIEKEFGVYLLAGFKSGRKIAVGQWESVGILDPTGTDKTISLTADALKGEKPDNVVVSPNDMYLACSTLDDDVLIWEVGSRKGISTTNLLPPGAKRTEWHLNQLRFTKSGEQLLLIRGSNDAEVPLGTPEEKVPAECRALFVIDVAKNQVIPLGLGHQDRTCDFALHPSDEWLVTSGARGQKKIPLIVGELRFYHFPTRTRVLQVDMNEDFFARHVLFTPDGKKLVAIDPQGKVRVWDFVGVAP